MDETQCQNITRHLPKSVTDCDPKLSQTLFYWLCSSISNTVYTTVIVNKCGISVSLVKLMRGRKTLSFSEPKNMIMMYTGAVCGHLAFWIASFCLFDISTSSQTVLKRGLVYLQWVIVSMVLTNIHDCEACAAVTDGSRACTTDTVRYHRGPGQPCDGWLYVWWHLSTSQSEQIGSLLCDLSAK